MMRIFFIASMLFWPLLIRAQILVPVRWTYSAKKVSPGEFALHLTAHIDKGWHIYAQDAGTGPIPTSFKFDQPGASTLGKVVENGKLIRHFDKSFNSELKYYENTVDFVQMVKAGTGVKIVKGTLEYEVCNDANCLPPKDIDFEIAL